MAILRHALNSRVDLVNIPEPECLYLWRRLRAVVISPTWAGTGAPLYGTHHTCECLLLWRRLSAGRLSACIWRPTIGRDGRDGSSRNTTDAWMLAVETTPGAALRGPAIIVAAQPAKTNYRLAKTLSTSS
jgi:hypothetical protein